MLLCISILFANLWQGQLDLSCIAPLDFHHPSLNQRIKTTTGKLLRLQTAVILNLILKTLFRQQTTTYWALLKAFPCWTPRASQKSVFISFWIISLMHLILDILPFHIHRPRPKWFPSVFSRGKSPSLIKHNIWNTTLFYLSSVKFYLALTSSTSYMFCHSKFSWRKYCVLFTQINIFQMNKSP